MKTTIRALLLGLPLTLLALSISFWIAHNASIIGLLLAPGLVVAPILGLNSGGNFWFGFSIVQFGYYFLIIRAFEYLRSNKDQEPNH